MKKQLLILLFITTVLAANLSAQMELTLVGGANLATVKYNDNTVDNYVDISMKSGLIIGLETVGGPFIIGGSFTQRGAIFKIDSSNFEGTDTYNYITGYFLYPVAVQNILSVFGGCQIGKSIGGTATYEDNYDSETYDLKAEDFTLDFGLLFGADFMFNSNVGARASYFIGLSDVIDGLTSDNNFKNRGIGLCLLYKL